MTRFDRCIPHILAHEGSWFTNDPVDPGGATKWGVSLRFALAELAADGDQDGWLDGDIDHDGDIDVDDIALLDKEQAIRIYRWHFWAPVFDEFNNEHVACKLFDMSVNMGFRQAAKLCQRALGVTDDGIIGPITLRAINNRAGLVTDLCTQQAAFYSMLVTRRPKLKRFITGWLRRALWRPDYAA